MDQLQILNQTCKVLDKGFVALESCMADDLMVVNSARVSFNKRSDSMTETDEKLIFYLMKNRHGTPFEHNSMMWRIKCPIFVAREWMRHRIGSFNEMSGRYVQLEPDFYIPEADAVRIQVGSPGRYTNKSVDASLAKTATELIELSYRAAFSDYEVLLECGIAKELARTVLPVGIYTEFYWTLNARSLMNFLSLRNAPTALLEIREYAYVIEEIFKNIMPVTMQAFLENGRIAP